MKINALKILVLLAGLISISFNSVAEGGIALGATRVIYSQSANQTSLPISNSSVSQRFLISSWVEDSNGTKVNSFVVTPPLFVIEPKTENTLRIIYVGSPLPKDRESLFYLNVKAIPSLDKNLVAGKNILQLAILSRIKLFVRPDDLPLQVSDVENKITFSKIGDQTLMKNPTPYYATLVNISIDGAKAENTMIAPFASVGVPQEGNKIIFQSINDYGALTNPQTSVIK